MSVVATARHAMATRFEIVLHGEDEVRLRASGEEALDEIERVEAQLSLFRPNSEIARVNARAAREPVRVSAPVFELLTHAIRLTIETGGAFDITVAPLMRCWGFRETTSVRNPPDPDEISRARECVGPGLIELNEAESSVRFARGGVMLDFGAIGKGYAIDCAVGILRETGVASALIHGGTSTVFALGRPAAGENWKIGIEDPGQERAHPSAAAVSSSAPPGKLLAVIALENEALSVSAVWGRSIEIEGRTYGHVIDPRTGQPVSDTALAAVILPSCTETDALSTALLTLGAAGQDRLSALRPGMKTLLLAGDKPADCLKVEARGFAQGEIASHDE